MEELFKKLYLGRPNADKIFSEIDRGGDNKDKDEETVQRSYLTTHSLITEEMDDDLHSSNFLGELGEENQFSTLLMGVKIDK